MSSITHNSAETEATIAALKERIAELEKENAALKDSNEFAWRNARSIDAVRMKAEAERDAAIKEVGKWSKEAGLAQSRIDQLRGTLEYIRQELRKGNGICDEIFDDALAGNTEKEGLK